MVNVNSCADTGPDLRYGQGSPPVFLIAGGDGGSGEMESARKQPALRLVRPSGSAAIGQVNVDRLGISAQHPDPKISVGQENWAAAQLSKNDPRWVLALRTVAELNGPILPAESRQRLLRNAQTLGLRTFDANLIMAVVQDRARRGEPIDQACCSLDFITKPVETRRPKLPWFALAAMVLAVEALGIWLLVGL